MRSPDLFSKIFQRAVLASDTRLFGLQDGEIMRMLGMVRMLGMLGRGLA